MKLIISLLFLTILGLYVWQVYSGYRDATGTVWERLLASAKDSATKLWAKFVGVVSAVVGALVTFSDFLGLPAVSNAVQAYAKPEYIALIMLGIAVITELARNRTIEDK